MAVSTFAVITQTSPRRSKPHTAAGAYMRQQARASLSVRVHVFLLLKIWRINENGFFQHNSDAFVEYNVKLNKRLQRLEKKTILINNCAVTSKLIVLIKVMCRERVKFFFIGT